jgi:hypothetical protein
LVTCTPRPAHRHPHHPDPDQCSGSWSFTTSTGATWTATVTAWDLPDLGDEVLAVVASYAPGNTEVSATTAATGLDNFRTGTIDASNRSRNTWTYKPETVPTVYVSAYVRQGNILNSFSITGFTKDEMLSQIEMGVEKLEAAA